MSFSTQPREAILLLFEDIFRLAGLFLKNSGNSRDKLSGTNGAKFAVFHWFLQIFAIPRNYNIWEAQIFAENCRKPQIFAENRRKPLNFAETHFAHLVRPFESCDAKNTTGSKSLRR